MRTIIPKNAKLIPEAARRVFKGEIFDVYQWPQKMFDGSIETFEMLKRADTIKIIAVVDDKIVILEEEQPEHTSSFIDFPGGRHDVESETELDAAKRELLEETGMSFKNWRLIKVEQPYIKMDWFIYLYLATGFEGQGEQKLDAGEKITVKHVDLNELKRLATNPKARHMPKDLIESCPRLENLLSLPECKN